MDETQVKELLGFLFHTLQISKRDLGALIGVDRGTISRWENTGIVDFGACQLLLQLLEGDLEGILPLLQERQKTRRPRAPWPDRVKAMRAAFHLTIAEFADLLMTVPSSIVNWEQGHSEPLSCHAVLLDLIEDQPDKMAGMLGFVPGDEKEETEWPPDRIQTILANADLTNAEFAEFAGIERQSVNAWLRGTSTPSSCSAFFLRALEKFPFATLRAFHRSDRGPWEPGRAQAARLAAQISANELSRLTGISARTLREWEDVMPTRMDCAKVLYSMIEHDPRGFLSLVRRISA